MPEFRYAAANAWYKGNTHIHSTASDGGKTFSELAEMYSKAGYDFLFRTDHWVASDVSADSTASPLLWLDGIEIDGRDYRGGCYHVVCLGSFKGFESRIPFVTALESARAQGGVLILAHPHWMENSPEDALRWGFHGVEIYNHVCQWLNGKSDGRVHWTAMLESAPNTLGFAVDDAHIRPEHPGWNGGWIMVNSSDLSRESILASIRAGSFYSSCGPEFYSIEFDGSSIDVQTSAVGFIRLVGPGWQGERIGSFDGQVFTEASFKLPADWKYLYLEIEDAQGRRAWTNTLFC